MDPEACLFLIRDALHDGQTDEACEHAEALLHWLSRGGFAPARTTAATVRTFCHAVRAWANGRGPKPADPCTAEPPAPETWQWVIKDRAGRYLDWDGGRSPCPEDARRFRDLSAVFACPLRDPFGDKVLHVTDAGTGEPCPCEKCRPFEANPVGWDHL